MTAMGMIGTPGPHGDLHEPAPPEAAKLVALGVGLARALGPLGEDHHQLLLLAQQAVGVVGVGLHAAEARPAHVDHRDALEDLVGQAVDGPPEVALDAVHDRRGVGGDGTGVVGHDEGAALAWGSCRIPPTRPGTSGRRPGRRCGGGARGAARSGPTRPRRTSGDRPAASTSRPRRRVAGSVVLRSVGSCSVASGAVAGLAVAGLAVAGGPGARRPRARPPACGRCGPCASTRRTYGSAA